MNATEDSLRSYVDILHRTVAELGAAVLEPDQAAQLLHNSLLPASIKIYVSTQFGVAFEYFRAENTSVETIRGSARVEELIFDKPRQLRFLQPMFSIEGHNCRISGGGKIGDAFPFRLMKATSDYYINDITYEVAALHWQRHVQYLEAYGDRSAENWSVAQAASRAKDEVLAAVYLAKQAAKQNTTLGAYVSHFRRKSVLVLGAYNSAGKQRLQDIVSALHVRGYEPVLVADIPDLEHYDISQKVVAIAAVSRFVVIDDSAPSGHLNEVELCKSNRWVTVLLRVNGFAASSMTLGASISSTVICEQDYDPNDPGPAIDIAVNWAEVRLRELEIQLRNIYPYRLREPTN